MWSRRPQQHFVAVIGTSALVAVLACLSLALSACSVRGLAINALADALTSSGEVFASDGDPELVRDATPFALKTLESLLAEKPKHRGLLLAACRGFTQYSFAFVEIEAEELEDSDFEAASVGYERALQLYLRARDYCFRAIDLELPGAVERLRTTPEEAVEQFGRDQVALLFWTGASWGSAISIGQHRPDLVADVPAVKALMERVVVLDEAYDGGAAHGVLIALEAMPEAAGGSVEKARAHFERAVELSHGQNASFYVTFAEAVSVPAQDWREFRELLQKALVIDPNAEPSLRLANLLAQRQAGWLLGRTEVLFLDYEATEEGADSG
jgi:predicted anti-sigma-YlaC factor YlaD